MKTETTPNHDLFGRVRLAYAVIATRRFEAWERLLGEGIGMQVSQRGSDDHEGRHMACRMDERACRILLRSGEPEDLDALGVELASPQDLHDVLQRLHSRGIPVEPVTGGEASIRGVERLWRFTGPKGLKIELCTDVSEAASPARTRASGFVTGDQGFGHVAIVTRRPRDMLDFWQGLFDVRVSDEVHQRISGVPLEFSFLRFNRRHHSIAFGCTSGLKLDPFRTRIQHLEVQVATLEDLTQAYERCRALGLTITMDVGQHANDRAVSFYVKSPSGFDVECGWNPLPVEEAAWKPQVWNRISAWGHRPSGVTAWDRAAQLGRAVASLGRKEYFPS